MSIEELMTLFLKTSLTFMGKEICLPSNQYFGIEQIIDEEKNEQEIYEYAIQYGFPQSGCISTRIDYLKQNNSVEVTKFTVYAQPADEQIMIGNIIPEEKIGELTIKTHFGVDVGTIEHSTPDEIEANPNAVKTIKLAINDLSKAEVIDECLLSVPIGSDRIPCANSTTKPRNLGL